MRFQVVDVVNVCYDCRLLKWAEGTAKAPCEQVCPQAAITVVPAGQGKAGFTGNGYLNVDRALCTGPRLVPLEAAVTLPCRPLWLPIAYLFPVPRPPGLKALDHLRNGGCPNRRKRSFRALFFQHLVVSRVQAH